MGDESPGRVVPAEEVTFRRVVRALRARRRYRYVKPEVRREGDGFVVLSPCCSRNVDASGGVIPIAWLQRAGPGWRLVRRDHAQGLWVSCREGSLASVLELLCDDPERVFWP